MSTCRIHPRIKTQNNLTFTFGKHWNNEILGQELNKYQNKHLAMYYILLYSNFTGVVGLPGQGVLSGNLLHLTDVHLTLGHCVTQLILRKCERDSRYIHLLHSTQKMLQNANHTVSHILIESEYRSVTPIYEQVFTVESGWPAQKNVKPIYFLWIKNH